MLGIVGSVVACLSFVFLLLGLLQRSKAKRVASVPLAPTGQVATQGAQVATPKGDIATQGNLVCPQPLVSPVTGTPCLYFKLTVTESWKDGDRQKSKEVESHKAAAQFAVDDGTGPVWVDATQGGDFDPTRTKEETKGTGLIGGITGQEIVFGNYRVSPGILSLGRKYTVREEVYPLQPMLYVCGRLQGNVIGSPSWRSLYLANKPQAEVLRAATSASKKLLLGGAIGSLVGAATIAVALIFFSADEPASTTTTSAATATANQPKR